MGDNSLILYLFLSPLLSFLHVPMGHGWVYSTAAVLLNVHHYYYYY